MPQQITVTPVSWSVGTGQIKDPETNEVRETRVAIMTDLITKDSYLFPMPEEMARDFGEVMQAEDIEAAQEQVARRHQLRVQRSPSEAELRKMADLAAGRMPRSG
jgi:hypothetical protein